MKFKSFENNARTLGQSPKEAQLLQDKVIKMFNQEPTISVQPTISKPKMR